MSNKISIVVIIILILSTGFLGWKYSETKKASDEAVSQAKEATLNIKVLDFTAMFIENVLKAETEISFETRLALETEVRSLNDAEILSQWQKFTNSSTEIEAQENVKKLLALLIDKVKN